jgi:alpha-L-fucosidase
VLRDIRVGAGAEVTMLGVPGRLKRKVEGDTLTITMPELGPEAAPCRHAYALKITAAELIPEK